MTSPLPASASTMVTSHRFVRHVLRDASRHALPRVPVRPDQLTPGVRALLQATLVAMAESGHLRPAGEEPRYVAEPFRNGVLVIASLPMERMP